MNNINVTSSNITFTSRNQNLRQADKILRKINKDFPSSSPWLADYKASRTGRIASEEISTKWSTAKLNAFREAQGSVVDKSYSKYISCLIEGLKRYKVANCKELSEIAYLIAKTNGIENGYCANLYLKDNKFKNNIDLEHSIFIINPNNPKNVGFADPYYEDRPTHYDLFEPNPKSIIIDPTFGFVEYWQNAKNIYQNMGFINPKNNEYITINLRKPLFKDEKEIHKTQVDYPILSLDNINGYHKQKHDFTAADIALEIYKTTKGLVVNDYPPADNSFRPIYSKKSRTFFDRIKGLIS